VADDARNQSASSAPPGRAVALDSLRGLAALSVVIHHCLINHPAFSDSSGSYWWLKASPLHAVWAGHEAVVLFFVLSGFVLSMSFLGDPRYLPFVVRRWFRIYVPYIVSVAVAVLAMTVAGHQALPWPSPWYEHVWPAHLATGDLTGHLALVSTFNPEPLNPVYWSLIHEMRISLVFPLLMLLVTRYDWRFSLPFLLLLSYAGGLANNPTPVNTLEYAVMFWVGAKLAQHREQLTVRYARLSRLQRLTLAVAAICAYTFSYWRSWGDVWTEGAVDDWAATLGASVFIVAALADPAARRLLLSAPVRALGRWSYSLYLLHAVVLIAFLGLLAGRIPLTAIFALTVVVAIAAAWLSYRLVEVPAIRAGRALADRMRRRRELRPSAAGHA